jgi:hypothetical protein
MNLRTIHWCLLLAVLALACLVSGCATDEPDNNSPRPWNTSSGWDSPLGGMGSQHR